MGDFKVTIDKNVLSDILHINHKKHVAEYKDTTETYLITLQATVANILSDLKVGKDVEKEVRRAANMPKPRSYGSEYLRVIRMLDMHTGDNLEISELEFRNYVQDDWGWSSDFIASSAPYSKSK